MTQRSRIDRVVAAARAIYDNRKHDDLEDELREIRLALEELDGLPPEHCHCPEHFSVNECPIERVTKLQAEVERLNDYWQGAADLDVAYTALDEIEALLARAQHEIVVGQKRRVRFGSDDEHKNSDAHPLMDGYSEPTV